MEYLGHKLYPEYKLSYTGCWLKCSICFIRFYKGNTLLFLKPHFCNNDGIGLSENLQNITCDEYIIKKLLE